MKQALTEGAGLPGRGGGADVRAVFEQGIFLHDFLSAPF